MTLRGKGFTGGLAIFLWRPKVRRMTRDSFVTPSKVVHGGLLFVFTALGLLTARIVVAAEPAGYEELQREAKRLTPMAIATKR